MKAKTTAKQAAFEAGAEARRNGHPRDTAHGPVPMALARIWVQGWDEADRMLKAQAANAATANPKAPRSAR